MKHFLVFGSHPFLSLAEARAVLGGRKPEMVEDVAIFSASGGSASGGDREDWDGAAIQRRLAGVVKLGDVVAEYPVENLTAELLAEVIEKNKQRIKGKVCFGLTVYGGSGQTRKKIERLPILLKRHLQEKDYSVRWVTGDHGELSPAAVAKMKLVSEGFDFVIIINGKTALIGLTADVQDANAWSFRDYSRPFRDARTGMLPPKLARLMANIAMGANGQIFRASATLLDPFCGSGTVLMETALIAQDDTKTKVTMIGSDMDKDQIKGCEKNLNWMVEKKLISSEIRDRISLHVEPVQTLDRFVPLSSVDFIVTEGYLGTPMRGGESQEVLLMQKKRIEQIWHDALGVFSNIQTRGGRVVCTWPVFVSPQGTVVVDLKEELRNFGYKIINPLEGWNEKSVTLTYGRPDQHIKRNVIVLERT